MAMGSLVLQLRSDCLDGHTSTLEVLRKALVVAKKLSVPKFQDWIGHELHGYGTDDELPEYRKVKGQLKARNPMVGWIPVVFDDPSLTMKLSEGQMIQSVGELESLLKTSGSSSMLLLMLAPELQKQIMQAGGHDFQTSLLVSPAVVQAIIDHVRTAVLEWCLDLEKAGILGEGMTFSPEEKKSASHINYAVHFHRDVTTAQIQQGTSESSQSLTSTVDVASLRSLTAEISGAIDRLGLQSEQQRQLTAELQSVNAQMQAPRPNHGIITEGLKSIRNILEGCAGSLLASGLVYRIGLLLS
jgi:hypothetical protein